MVRIYPTHPLQPIKAMHNFAKLRTHSLDLVPLPQHATKERHILASANLCLSLVASAAKIASICARFAKLSITQMNALRCQMQPSTCTYKVRQAEPSYLDARNTALSNKIASHSIPRWLIIVDMIEEHRSAGVANCEVIASSQKKVTA